MLQSIRGAITAEQDTAEAVLGAAKTLLTEIFSRNGLKQAQVISVFFTMTKDLQHANPAAAARDFGLTQAALMCAQEADVCGGLAKCIRVQVNAWSAQGQAAARHVYLGEAKCLRPDLADDTAVRPLDVVAIDGPSGAGKSTVAKMVAEKLGFIYIDTGAMYRAAALYGLRAGVGLSDDVAVANTLDHIHITLRHEDGVQQIFLNGENVTVAIRTQEAAEGASAVAVHAAVRLKMVALQQVIAAQGRVVMDGRDIGTHVLPNAVLKVFLTASADERTRRRCAELQQKGLPSDYETVRREIEKRDYRDTNRAASPLRQADDAFTLDTSGLLPGEAAAAIVEMYQKRVG